MLSIQKKNISKIPDHQQFRYPNKYARKKISNDPLNLISPNRFNPLSIDDELDNTNIDGNNNITSVTVKKKQQKVQENHKKKTTVIIGDSIIKNINGFKLGKTIERTK